MAHGHARHEHQTFRSSIVGTIRMSFGRELVREISHVASRTSPAKRNAKRIRLVQALQRRD